MLVIFCRAQYTSVGSLMRGTVARDSFSLFFFFFAEINVLIRRRLNHPNVSDSAVSHSARQRLVFNICFCSRVLPHLFLAPFAKTLLKFTFIKLTKRVFFSKKNLAFLVTQGSSFSRAPKVFFVLNNVGMYEPHQQCQ